MARIAYLHAQPCDCELCSVDLTARDLPSCACDPQASESPHAQPCICACCAAYYQGLAAGPTLATQQLGHLTATQRRMVYQALASRPTPARRPDPRLSMSWEKQQQQQQIHSQSLSPSEVQQQWMAYMAETRQRDSRASRPAQGVARPIAKDFAHGPFPGYHIGPDRRR
jgi:hypothetical protein